MKDFVSLVAGTKINRQKETLYLKCKYLIHKNRFSIYLESGFFMVDSSQFLFLYEKNATFRQPCCIFFI